MLRIFVVIITISLPTFAAAEFSGPVRVIDGDTIDVGSVRVRIHGIDAPESWQQCRTEFGNNFECGGLATEQLREMSQGQIARCTKTDYDTKYSRVVARCFVKGVDLGQAMVSRGYALAYRKYSKEYVRTEAKAKAADRGLHTTLMQDPSWVRQTRAIGRIPLDNNCRIKGNISANGRIFHSPGQRFYERTGIRPEKGERWFCSKAEARAAGWREALS